MSAGATSPSLTATVTRERLELVSTAPDPRDPMLLAWSRGERSALDETFYRELHHVAALHLARERSGHTFSPTALLHEAYLRLANADQLEIRDRAHLLATASKIMRQILVDHARRRCAGKRGDGRVNELLDEQLVAVDRPWDLVELDHALRALAEHDERKARVVELHYFGGLTQEEIAAVCELHVNTVARDLRFAEAWLRKELQEGASH